MELPNSIKDKLIFHSDFPENQYIKEEHKKSQIVLHHTVSGIGVNGDINTFAKNGLRISTSIIIGHDGLIHQLFNSKYWGYHLGLKTEVFTKNKLSFKNLDKTSIGIEIDSAGGLKKDVNGIWVDIYGHKLSNDSVIEYKDKYRGYYAFEKYTNEQIETLKNLLLYFNKVYDISLNYNENMFDLSVDALSGKNGIWSHTSFRIDKSDVHPQKELIDMLKSLINN